MQRGKSKNTEGIDTGYTKNAERKSKNTEGIHTGYRGDTPGGLPYITDGDARRNFKKQPLKVTIFGVAPANFIP